MGILKHLFFGMRPQEVEPVHHVRGGIHDHVQRKKELQHLEEAARED